jgi:ABC-type lipoprotein release transport system permease subunit
MKPTETPTPPQWPLRLLRLLVKDEYLEEIEGDMEELFHDYAAQHSHRQARRMYTWEMLKLLRPILLKKIASRQPAMHLGMFSNYFKISIRGLSKNPFHSFINLFGLAIAIGISILMYGFARWTYSTDQFHEHKNEVYLATFFANREGSSQQYGLTPRPLGERLQKDFAQVKKMCRIEDRKAVVKYQDNVFQEPIRYVDPTFLEMFTFPLKWGTAKSLADVNSIILSEDMAVKYFGESNPVGQTIQLIVDKSRSKAFRVAGVAQKFPEACTIAFHFLVNFENMRSAEAPYDVHDWNAFVNATLIQVDNPADLQTIARDMNRYKALQNAAAPADWAITSFAFEPLATLYTRSAGIRNDISSDSAESNAKAVIFLCVIGAFMLALACFNYINIAIVSAAKRLKEIGVRKTMGATRWVVIVQFLSENMVTTFFALIIGIVLGAFVFIPAFEYNSSFDMDFRLADPLLWLYLPVILVITGVLSGIYPSLYISGFQIVGILKGTVKFGRKNPVTKLFLSIQLILSCLLITCAVMFTQNSNYLTNRSWGYAQHQVLYVSVPDYTAFEKLKAAMLQNPDVVSVAGARDHLGKKHTSTVVHLPNRPFEVDELAVDPGYVQTMGLQLATGQDFKKDYETDKQRLLVNDLFVKKLALKNPVGAVVKIEGLPYQIAGIVKDFHSYDFSTKVNPTIFRVAEKETYRYLTIHVRPGTEHKTYQAVQSHWSQLYPELPFEGGYQEDVWNYYYQEIASHSRFWIVIACIAVVLTSLGLYGLVKLNIAGRIKEFSIRKILGASVRSLADNVTRQYLILLAITLSLAAPLSYVLMNVLFDSTYEYHVPITYAGVLLAVFLLVLVVLTTLSIQIVKVIRANPIQGLKTE